MQPTQVSFKASRRHLAYYEVRIDRYSAGWFVSHSFLNLETLTRLCIAKMLILPVDLILEVGQRVPQAGRHPL